MSRAIIYHGSLTNKITDLCSDKIRPEKILDGNQYKYGHCISKIFFGRDADIFFLVQSLEALGMQSTGDKNKKID